MEIIPKSKIFLHLKTKIPIRKSLGQTKLRTRQKSTKNQKANVITQQSRTTNTVLQKRASAAKTQPSADRIRQAPRVLDTSQIHFFTTNSGARRTSTRARNECITCAKFNTRIINSAFRAAPPADPRNPLSRARARERRDILN